MISSVPYSTIFTIYYAKPACLDDSLREASIAPLVLFIILKIHKLRYTLIYSQIEIEQTKTTH